LGIVRDATTNPSADIGEWGSALFNIPSGQEVEGSGFCPARSDGLIYIEQVSACVKNPPFLIGKNEVAKVAVLFRPRCKSWDCPTCAIINKNLWVLRTYRALEILTADGTQFSMVTITGHEKHSLGHAIACYPDQWNKLQSRWRREVGKPTYAMFPEMGDDNDHFHAHILTDKWATERWWKDNARESGMGYMADEGDYNIPPEKAAGYASKYLGKQLGTKWEKGFRRVRTSQNWPKVPQLSKDENWTFELLPRMVSLADAAETLRENGYRVALADHKSAWTIVDAC